jgi:hypothetical protein
LDTSNTQSDSCGFLQKAKAFLAEYAREYERFVSLSLRNAITSGGYEYGTRIEIHKATLWKAAGTFRGSIDAANYKRLYPFHAFSEVLDDTNKVYIRDLEEKYNGNQVRIERAKQNLQVVLVTNSGLIICMITSLM